MNLAEFRQYQLRRGYSPLTIESNIAFLKIPPNEAFSSQNSLDSYITSKVEEGKSANYINRLLVAVRLYGKYSGISWMEKIESVRGGQETEKSILKEDKLRRFLEVVEGDNKAYKRHYEAMQMFWEICLFTGRRLGEVASLRQSMIRWDDKIFYLGKNKTGKRKIIPISVAFEDKLKTYLENHDFDLLFPSRQDKEKPINNHVWGKSFRKRLALAGIDKLPSLTPYSTRHSTITATLSPLGGNVPLLDAMNLFGHTDPKVTAGYYHLDTGIYHYSAQRIPLARDFINPMDFLKQLKAWLETIIAPFKERAESSTEIKEDDKSVSLTFKLRIKK